EGWPDTVVKRQVAGLLARRHGFDPSDPGAVSVYVAMEEYRKLQSLLSGIRLAVLVVGLGTLLSAMIGVSNILLVSVRERIPEFGVRRALGATSGSVLTLVLVEALVMAGLSGAAGAAAGMALVALVRGLGLEADYFAHPEVAPAQVAGALAVLLLAA